MSKKLFRIILPLTIMLFLIGTNTSCIYFSPIVGKWHDNSTGYIMEFTRDGKIIINADNYVITGTYQLVSGDVVNLSLEGDAGNLMGMTGSNSFQFKISGNAMTITGGGSSGVLYRVVNQTTPTTTTKALSQITGQSTIKLTYPIGGETWHVGQTVTIKWTSSNLPSNDTVSLQLSADGGKVMPWMQIGERVTNTGSYKWVVSGVTVDTHTATFRISSITYSDYSKEFTILTK
jgi:hypothetical protein